MTSMEETSLLYFFFFTERNYTRWQRIEIGEEGIPPCIILTIFENWNFRDRKKKKDAYENSDEFFRE